MRLIKTKKIAVVGAGGWGKNHIRTLADLGCLSAIIDSDEIKLNELSVNYDNINILKVNKNNSETNKCGWRKPPCDVPLVNNARFYPAGACVNLEPGERHTEHIPKAEPYDMPEDMRKFMDENPVKNT